MFKPVDRRCVYTDDTNNDANDDAQSMIAVCAYHLVVISIEMSETAQKSTLEIQDKIQFKNFFPNGQ